MLYTLGTLVFELALVHSQQICQETVVQGKTCTGQGCRPCFTLNPRSRLASVKVKSWILAVCQGVKVWSTDMFDVHNPDVTASTARRHFFCASRAFRSV